MALATVADYEAVTGTTVVDTGRFETLLQMASDAIVAAADGQLIELVEDDTVTLREHNGCFLFPQRQVTEVVEVVIDGVTLTEGTDYRWTAGGYGRHATLIRRVAGYDSAWVPGTEAAVTYSHGWATIPGQVIAACVALVKGVIDNGGGGAVTQRTLGSFSESYADPQPGDFSVPGHTRSLLAELVGAPGPTSVETRPVVC